MENLTYTCGHSDTEAPRSMGRGQARVKRLQAWYHRPCLACALAKINGYVDSLTLSTTLPANHPDVIARRAEKKAEIALRTNYSYNVFTSRI